MAVVRPYWKRLVAYLAAVVITAVAGLLGAGIAQGTGLSQGLVANQASAGGASSSEVSGTFISGQGVAGLRPGLAESASRASDQHIQGPHIHRTRAADISQAVWELGQRTRAAMCHTIPNTAAGPSILRAALLLGGILCTLLLRQGGVHLALPVRAHRFIPLEANSPPL